MERCPESRFLKNDIFEYPKRTWRESKCDAQQIKRDFARGDQRKSFIGGKFAMRFGCSYPIGAECLIPTPDDLGVFVKILPETGWV